ncbi:MAG: pantoate--beta-alanine ligase [Candidatus Omnitrophica bacterium]|nr:pantoate--beta-alanine ligase [Candidatus Omnitrophota bacterium]
MRIIRSLGQMQSAALRARRAGKTIGFVPTMGALHDGHASLIRAARRDTDVVVVSIFVNPLQFGPREDYRRYPRTFQRDVAVAKRAGCDVLFAPTAAAMYPKNSRTVVVVTGLSEQLEGASRPGHFRGVATVVAKLFHLVQPTAAYVGQKDYQQSCLIRRMVDDLDVPVRVNVLPTVRERDGLAMSSRNAYLTPQQRREAPVLARALRAAARNIRRGERRASTVRAGIARALACAPHARVDRIDIVDAATLEPVARLRGRVALLAAIRLGGTRLIDNVLVAVP